MSETPPPSVSVPEQKPNEWRSPQVILPIIATLSTVLVALIGVLPSLIEAGKPAATPTPMVVVLATDAPVATTIVPTTAAPTDAPPSSTPLPESTAVPTNTSEPTQAPTNTPLPAPIQIPTDVPTLIAAPTTPPNFTLFYDTDSFTIMNISGARASLEGVVFRSSAATWDISPFGGLMKSLPNNKCLRMRDAMVGNRTPPAACGSQMYGFLEIGPKVIFWRDVETFDVLRSDSLIATCEIAAGTCGIYVEQ